MTSSLAIRVLTPKRPVFEGLASSIVVPSVEGQLTFLPEHARYVGQLAVGTLKVVGDDSEARIFVAEGSIEFADGQVLVLALSAQHLDDIDLTRAEQEVASAKTRLAQLSEVTGTDYLRQKKRLERAQGRIDALAEHKRT